MELAKNLKKRIIEDEIEVEGRTFKLKKFDPLTGNYILFQLLTMTLPFGLSALVSSAVGSEKSVEQQPTKMMSKADFLALQKDVLSECYEILQSGEVPVVRENGTYGIQNFTLKIASSLLIASIAFNFTSFFKEVLSEEEQD